jgi:hypothetical protein
MTISILAPEQERSAHLSVAERVDEARIRRQMIILDMWIAIGTVPEAVMLLRAVLFWHDGPEQSFGRAKG